MPLPTRIVTATFQGRPAAKVLFVLLNTVSDGTNVEESGTQTVADLDASGVLSQALLCQDASLNADPVYDWRPVFGTADWVRGVVIPAGTGSVGLLGLSPAGAPLTPTQFTTLEGLITTEQTTRAAADTAETSRATTAEAGKAASVHTHAEADVTALVTDLAGKVPSTRLVAGHALSADVTLTATDVGADASGAAAAAQAAAATDATSKVATETTRAQSAEATNASAIALKAPLASPALTGTPTAPTAAPGTASTQVATTAYANAAVTAQHTADNGTYASLTSDNSLAGLQTFTKSPVTLSDTTQEYERLLTQSLAGGTLSRGAWQRGIDVGNTTNPHRDYFTAFKENTRAFADAVTASASALLTSPVEATFALADIGAAVSGAGIPAATTITAVATATVQNASADVALPTGTITVDSTAAFAAAGTIAVWTTTGWQAVAYTGLTGTTFTGCTGGTGNLLTGSPVGGQATMSNPATATASGVTVTLTLSGGKDVDYWAHNGGRPATRGVGVTPPSPMYRQQMVGATGGADAAAMGVNLIVAGNGMVSLPAAGGHNGAGFAQAIRDWSGKDRAWMEFTTAGGWAYRQRADQTSKPAYVLQDVSTDVEYYRITQAGRTSWTEGGSSAGRAPQATWDAQFTAAGGRAFQAASAAAGFGNFNITIATGATSLGNSNAQPLQLQTNGVTAASIPAAGGFVVGTAALATTVTDGFLYLPSCAGVPTGVPTTRTGTVPLIVDTTDSKVYGYIGGAWKAVTLA